MVSFAKCISKFFVGKESNTERKISDGDESPCLVSDEGNFDKISDEGNFDTTSPEKIEERVETRDYPWDLKLFLDTCTTHKRGAVMSESESAETGLNHRNSLPSEDSSNQEPQVKHIKKKKRKRGKENKNNSEKPKPKKSHKRCKIELGALQPTKNKDQENSQKKNSSEVLVAGCQKSTTGTPLPLPQAVTSAAPAFRTMRQRKTGFRTLPSSMQHFDPLKAAMYPAVVQALLGPILSTNVNDKIVVVIPSDISFKKKMRFACPDGKTVDFSFSALHPIRPNMDLVLDLTAARKKISDQTSVSGTDVDLAVLAQTALTNRFVSWINKGSCEAGRSSIKRTQQPRVLLEDVNEEMLRALPTPYSDKFQKIGFTSLKSIRYPVLILRPTDAPIRQRLEWLAMYQRHSKGKGPLLHLVVYFGFPAIKTETCLTYGLVRSVLLYEEAANRNCHTLPTAIKAKVDKGNALNAKERSLLDGFAILDAARETSEEERLRLAQDMITKNLVFNKKALLRIEDLQHQIPGDARAKFSEVGFAKFKHCWYPVLIIDPQYLPKRRRCEWLCRFQEYLNGDAPFLHSVIFYGFPEDDEKYGFIETVLSYEVGLKKRCHELPTAILLKIATGGVLTAHDQHLVDGLSFLDSALKSKKQDRLQHAESMCKQKKTLVLSNMRDGYSAPDTTAPGNKTKNQPNTVLATPNVAVENEASGASLHDQLVGETVQLVASIKKTRGRSRKVVANDDITVDAAVNNEASGTSSRKKLEETAQQIAPVNKTRGRSRKVVANDITLGAPVENEVVDVSPPEKLVGETAQQIAPVNKTRGRPRKVGANDIALGVPVENEVGDDSSPEKLVGETAQQIAPVNSTRGRPRKIVANDITVGAPVGNEVGDDSSPERLVGEKAQHVAPLNKKRGRSRNVVTEEFTLRVRQDVDVAEEKEVKRRKDEAHVVEQTKAESTFYGVKAKEYGQRPKTFKLRVAESEGYTAPAKEYGGGSSTLKQSAVERFSNKGVISQSARRPSVEMFPIVATKTTTVIPRDVRQEPRKQSFEEKGIPSPSSDVFLDSAGTSVKVFPLMAEMPSRVSPYDERQKILNQLEVKQTPPNDGSSAYEQHHLPKITFDDSQSYMARHSSTSSGRQMCSYSKCKQFAVQSGVCFDHGASRKTCSDPSCTYWAVSSGVWCYKHGLTKKPRNLWV